MRRKLIAANNDLLIFLFYTYIWFRFCEKDLCYNANDFIFTTVQNPPRSHYEPSYPIQNAFSLIICSNTKSAKG